MLNVKKILTKLCVEMKTMQGRSNAFYTTRVSRNTTYRLNGAYDAAILVLGKYGSKSVMSMVLRNGGTPSVIDYGSTERITATVDASQRLNFAIADYTDGRAIVVYYAGDNNAMKIETV